MKVSRSLLAMMAFATVVVGCSHEEILGPDVVEGGIPLNISGSIKQVQTKATAEGFVDKDAVGLYAVNYSENNTVAGTLAASGNQADNVKYIFDEPNQKWAPVKSVYYKDVNTHADLYLYYPYQANVTDVNSYGFEVKKDQSTSATSTELSGYEASDLLWGMTEDVTPSESKVGIRMNHMLSAVQVTLVEGEGFDEDEFDSLAKGVILTNTTRKATFNFANGDVSPLGEAQLDGIVMCPQENGSFRAIVIPQSISAGTQLFAITIDGISYSFSQSSSVAYQKGKQLNASISINKKNASGEYEFVLTDTQIVDWTEDRNTHGGEARQYFVVNVEEPGTLQAVIEAAGKNPAKIKNLKVTGIIDARDYAFMRDNMTILEALNLHEVTSDCYVQTPVSGVGVASYSNWSNAEHNINSGEWLLSYVYGTKYFLIRIADMTSENVVYNAIPEYAFYGKKSLYYCVLPENITGIGSYAFSQSNISGNLTIPDNTIFIGNYSFSSTKLSALSFSNKLTTIGQSAFNTCSSLSGRLSFPQSLKYIGSSAFWDCQFTGTLVLPDNLEYLGSASFHTAGTFVGDLSIPERIVSIQSQTFENCGFTGHLNLNNVTSLGSSSFYNCGFTGELVIPEGVKEIPYHCFWGNRLSNVVFPSTIKTIGSGAFYASSRLTCQIVLKEGLISIGSSAFSASPQITGIELPSTLQTIETNAFYGCYNVSKMIIGAIEPPTVQSGAFYGVSKDNLTLEVPSQSIKRYQSETGWGEFKRIAAHYDFSISRDQLRALNGELSRTYILRAPAEMTWSIESKPDWVSVAPSSGTGKTDVTITVSQMDRISEQFEVNEGTFNSPKYKKYSGRAGEVVFLLDEKNYTTSIEIEQYDYDYSDGYVKTYQTATKGNGIDIVFIGDGYDARDIAKGTFLTNAESGYNYFFDVEPYKTYKDYFNVYAVISMSDESGIGTVNSVVDTKFGSYFTQNRILAPNPIDCFTWAKKADASMNLSKSLVIMLQNTSTYEGVTMMYGDDSAIACCPVSTDAYPYDFRGIIQHEAGGHGFGKLGDEYIYHNAFIQTCICTDGCDHPQSDNDLRSAYGDNKARGWYKNLSMNGDNTQVPWAHLIYNPQYSDYVDMYEGGYMHSRGMYRSEATSCMNNNIPYYSAISRQAIVERIMGYAGEGFTLEKFYANDNDSFGTTTKATRAVDRTYGVDPKFVRATGEGPMYMGERPDVK